VIKAELSASLLQSSELILNISDYYQCWKQCCFIFLWIPFFIQQSFDE